MYRKRWTVKALRMDLRYNGDLTYWRAPALANMICILFFSLMLHEEAVHSSRLVETDAFQEWPTLDSSHYFDTTTPSNVTGLVGETVELLCKVKNRGNKTVSWVRHRDIHLLTVNYYIYTSDQRIQSIHNPNTEEWILKILNPQKKDSGIYECQVSTTPPTSRRVYLTVVEPETEIAGGPDLFINKYSTINLTCLVKYAPDPPSTIVWSHNHEPINFDSPKGGISLITEKGPVTSSRLLIQKATEKDSGLYTCAPNNTRQNSVRVHIVNEHPAAMHHGSGDRTAATLLPLVLLLFAII
ncbi:zwei Ig domain protein zig-8 isoform X1 [Megachile rotundata]|uniref:zwei Ig domain protein zig-8 isoform X1 n=1 Tax=Megachile rotundata TaxID=143995 RepID=UPI003FD500FD